MGRRSGVTANDTRRELLDATIEVLLAKGVEGARVSEIARVTGVTPAAIYNHFPSKTELVAAAIAQQAPQTIANLLDQDGEGRVINAVRVMGQRLASPDIELAPLLLELIVTATRDPEVAAMVGGGIAEREARRADVLRTAQDAGEVDAGLDSEVLARVTTTFALGALVVSTLEMKPIDSAAWELVLDRLLAAVQPEEQR